MTPNIALRYSTVTVVTVGLICFIAGAALTTVVTRRPATPPAEQMPVVGTAVPAPVIPDIVLPTISDKFNVQAISVDAEKKEIIAKLNFEGQEKVITLALDASTKLQQVKRPPPSSQKESPAAPVFSDVTISDIETDEILYVEVTPQLAAGVDVYKPSLVYVQR